ncbi:MAG TPA: NAD-dependent epimerase/dehydratase family protein [Dehalococcoidia bacterium]|nr:NAD-dependent epimerase/dehydratase family protein [Dehalococcoidia bacterium]
MLATVTGASGHLGANLVRELISQGWKVRTLVHRDTRALEGLDVERIYGDILDRESLKAVFSGVDAVFHLAARISVAGWERKEVEAVNTTGVENVTAACMAAGVRRLVHVSSFHALNQEPLDKPLDESRSLVGGGSFPAYNRSKAEGERIVGRAMAQGLNAVIVSPTGMIGPFDFQPSHFGAVLLAMAQGKLAALVDAGLDWVDARDVASGVICACNKAEKGEKYILGGHWITLKEIARYVSQVTGRKPPGLVMPMWTAKAVAPFAAASARISGKRPLFTPISMKELESNRTISHIKASSDLDYEPRSLQNTIADTLDWFQANGFLSRGQV